MMTHQEAKNRRLAPWARCLAALLAFFMALSLAFPAFAGGGDLPVEPKTQETASTAKGGEGVPKLPCRSAILMEQSTGRVLYEENADEQMPPASITKIMTLLLTMEALDAGKITLEDKVTCSPHANSMGGTQIWLEIGEQMTVRDLIKATAVVSANDASVALGEYLAGSEEGFVDLMNRRAKELGMKNTHFVNATGLDAPGHVTCARDIAIMSAELLKHPEIKEYTTIWMDTLRDGKNQLVNTNKLIRFYKGATGLKTGTTNDAGSCLSATATRGNLSLVAVTLGSDTSDHRFASCRALLDYGFANYDAIPAPDISGELQPIKVRGGMEPQVAVTCEQPLSIVLEKGQKDQITQQVEMVKDLSAPVDRGQRVGTVKVSVAGEMVGEYPITAAEEVLAMNFPLAFLKLWGILIAMQ